MEIPIWQNGCFKVNINGSFLPNRDVSGVGSVIRSHAIGWIIRCFIKAGLQAVLTFGYEIIDSWKKLLIFAAACGFYSIWVTLKGKFFTGLFHSSDDILLVCILIESVQLLCGSSPPSTVGNCIWLEDDSLWLNLSLSNDLFNLFH